MKKRWFFIPLSVALLILVIGITSGAVMAQESGTEEGSRPPSFASRVATILGLGEDEVQAAFDQAAREHQDEALKTMLTRLVDNEKISQIEADEISAWFVARPDEVVHMRRALFLGEEALQHNLARMKKYGKITQEEADAVVLWYQLQPDALQTIYQLRRHRGQQPTDEPAAERARPFDRQSTDSFGRPGARQDGAGNASGEDAIKRLLDRLVAQDQITQADKDEIQQWITDKPDAIPPGRWIFLGEGLLKQRLDPMVENRRITQEQADMVLDWFRSRPAGMQALNQFLGRHGRQPADQSADGQVRPSGQNRGDRFNGPELRQDGTGDFPAPALQGSL